MLDAAGTECEGGGGGVDILFVVSSKDEVDVASILIIGSLELLLPLLGRGDSICGDICPLLFDINELLNGLPDSVKPVKSLTLKIRLVIKISFNKY